MYRRKKTSNEDIFLISLDIFTLFAVAGIALGIIFILLKPEFSFRNGDIYLRTNIRKEITKQKFDAVFSTLEKRNISLSNFMKEEEWKLLNKEKLYYSLAFVGNRDSLTRIVTFDSLRYRKNSRLLVRIDSQKNNIVFCDVSYFEYDKERGDPSKLNQIFNVIFGVE